MCTLAEITWNETVWSMRTNNVKRFYWHIFWGIWVEAELFWGIWGAKAKYF